MTLPAPLQPLAEYPQFILWTLRDGKKLPINFNTLRVCSAHDPAAWMPYDTAALLATPEYKIGWVVTEAARIFFLDIDNCLTPAGWSPLALEVLTALPGAAVEVSQSGRGLHVFGRYSGPRPTHTCKNTSLGLELYTADRFVALTGDRAQGNAATDCTAALAGVIAKYFQPSGACAATPAAEWTDGPCEGYTGPADDEQLIAKALASASAAAAFGDRASFRQLWEADADAFARAYPDPQGLRPYDASSADAALAVRLAFWTGRDCERIRRLMQRSGLCREKYQREDYLPRTILRACSLTTDYLGSRPTLPKLRAASDAQRAAAEKIRDAKLAVATDEQRAILTARDVTAKFWLDTREQPLVEMCARRTVAPVAAPTCTEPTVVTGYQYLTADAQVNHFKGCVYVLALNKIFTPDGSLLKAEQFNASYGGFVFQIDDSGEKTTRKAWEAFTESQVVRFPRAYGTCFRPSLPTGAFIEEEGRTLVNAYYPAPTPRASGDPAPFIAHVTRLLPVPEDRAILTAYMAACVQHIGVKFQWCPLLQGVEGNGKTLLTRCVAAAVGSRYTHFPPATEISEKFNAWLFYKLFIGIEDVYVADNKREIIEVLKPMITNDRLAMREMQQSQVMGDNYANFMLNSNHKDAILKTRNDRRFCVFYTAQQSPEDLQRDGMNNGYFPQLYKWLREGGYAIVSEYLATYPIPPALNPATDCHRAPETSSTREVLTSSLGSIEQEIMEAIEEGRPGFAGGWVSSVAIDRLLHNMRPARSLARNKRREMMQAIGYDLHAGLPGGRVNKAVLIDDGKKPKLFIKIGHPAASMTDGAAVALEYQRAQGAPI
jgi:hypothetical protein